MLCLPAARRAARDEEHGRLQQEKKAGSVGVSTPGKAT